MNEVEVPEIAGDPRTTAERDLLRHRFVEFAATTAARSPLYARLARAIAAEDDLIDLLRTAPGPQRLPVLLFASVHFCALRADEIDEIHHHYPSLAHRSGGDETRTTPGIDDDPVPAFLRFCRHHREHLRGLIATRSVQTNEVGRCALLLPLLSAIGETEDAIAMIDVGASAGLNLAFDRYHYRYDPGGSIGAPSPVLLECGVRGPIPTINGFPQVAWRAGLDREPVDLGDPDSRIWLEACVWPDQADRLARLRAAIEVTHDLGVSVRRADAVTGLPAMLDEAARMGHPVVVNTWMLSYLDDEQRREYLAVLDRFGSGTDLSWVLLESPEAASGLPIEAQPDRAQLTHLAIVTWRSGRRTQRTVATAHPHGYWIHWSE